MQYEISWKKSKIQKTQFLSCGNIQFDITNGNVNIDGAYY